MFFKDIIGQAPVKEKLLHMLQDGRVPHALMFTGPDGSGNLPAAFALIQYLFCKQNIVFSSIFIFRTH